MVLDNKLGNCATDSAASYRFFCGDNRFSFFCCKKDFSRPPGHSRLSLKKPESNRLASLKWAMEK